MNRTILAAIVVLVGCHRTEPAPKDLATRTPRAPIMEGKAYFQLSPPDLTTAADDAMISVFAEFRGPVPVEFLTEVASKLSLVTWPEGTPVAWSASFRIASSSRDRDPFSKVLVQPSQPLSSRWYALKVAPLDGRLALRPMTVSLDSLQPGETMVRFRHGSEPRVVAIDESYQEEDQRYPFLHEFPYLIEVMFSETVPTTDAVAAIGLGGLGAIACEPAPAHGDITGRVAFRCRSSVMNNLGVAVGALPIRGSAPAAASAKAASTTIQVDPSKVVVVADNIKRYNIELR